MGTPSGNPSGASPFYAHTRDGRPASEWQLLAVHLRNVADLAARFAKEAQPNDPSFADSARLAGLLHDLGKYRPEFQEYLRHGGTKVPHAPIGAAVALREGLGVLHAFAPYGHHAGLSSWEGLKGLDTRYDGVLETVWRNALKDCPELSMVSQILVPDEFAKNRTRGEVWIRMLFSCLVDADWSDTNAWKEEDRPYRYNPIPLDPDNRLASLTAFLAGKTGEGPINAIRREVMRACLDAAGKRRGFFSLPVPTGGGKTLAALAFALKHCLLHHTRRIIYVAPFLNILGQTAKEFYGALGASPGDGSVLEHHSLAQVGQSRDLDEGGRIEGDGPEEAEGETHWSRRMAENWIAPIILTSSVQFFESLFSNRPGVVRKLHHISRSVVIFDECQVFPKGLYAPTLSMLKDLVRDWGVTFVFCTATQPAIRQTAAFKEGIPENDVLPIIEDTRSLFRRMHRSDQAIPRVRVEWPSPGSHKTWEDLAREMRKCDSALAVVNVKEHARRLFGALYGEGGAEGKEEVFYLSTDMCSQHRSDVLNQLQRRLNARLPCFVASTQLVEAGVNLDFPAVFRAIGPLDSIAQAAGRCNREGLLRDEHGQERSGRVVVFRPEEDKAPRGEYQIATETCRTMLAAAIAQGRSGPDILTPDTYDEYFASTLAKLDPDGKAIESDYRKRLNYPEVARLYRIIEENTCQVVVPYSPDGQECNSAVQPVLEEVRKNGRVTMEQARGLQPYIVNLYHHNFLLARNLGLLEPLVPDWWSWTTGVYDAKLGIRFELKRIPPV